MKVIAFVSGVIVLALAVAAGAVFLGGDSTTLVPPPEAVAESFMHQVQAGRYDRTMQYVESSSSLSESVIRETAADLEKRAGDIEHVEGESAVIAGDTATAIVKVTTERSGILRSSFSLARRFGQWRITDWPPP